MSGLGPTSSVNSDATRPSLYRHDSDNVSNADTVIGDHEGGPSEIEGKVRQSGLFFDSADTTQVLKSLVAYAQSLVVLSDARKNGDALLKAYRLVQRQRRKEPFIVGEGAVESDLPAITLKSETGDSLTTSDPVAEQGLKKELKATLNKAKELLTEFRGSLTGLSSVIFKRVKELFGSDQKELSLLGKPELGVATSESGENSSASVPTRSLEEKFETAVSKAEKLLTESKDELNSSSLFKQIKNLFGNIREKRLSELLEKYEAELQSIKELIESCQPSSGLTETQANKFTAHVNELGKHANDMTKSRLRKVPKLADSRFLHGLISSVCSVTSAGFFYYTGAAIAAVGFFGAAVFITGFIGFWLYGKYKGKGATKWKGRIDELDNLAKQLILLGNEAMSTILTDHRVALTDHRVTLDAHGTQINRIDANVHEDRKKIEELEEKLAAKEKAEAEMRNRVEKLEAALEALLGSSPRQSGMAEAPQASSNADRRPNAAAFG